MAKFFDLSQNFMSQVQLQEELKHETLEGVISLSNSYDSKGASTELHL